MDKQKIMMKALDSAGIKTMNGDTFYLEERPIAGEKLLKMTNSIINQVTESSTNSNDQQSEEEILSEIKKIMITIKNHEENMNAKIKELSNKITGLNKENKKPISPNKKKTTVIDETKNLEQSIGLQRYDLVEKITGRGKSNLKSILKLLQKYDVTDKLFTISDVMTISDLPKSSIIDVMKLMLSNYKNFETIKSSTGSRKYFIK